MHIEYELDESDFIDSFAAHSNGNIFSKWLKRLLMSVFFLVIAFLAFGLTVRPSAQNMKNLMPFFGLILLWVGLLWALPRWNARKQFLKQPGAQGHRSVSFDDSGAHWRWNGGSADITWKNFVRSLEGENQFLLYTSPACFNIIPKRALTEEGLLELRDLLKQNIPG